MPSAAIGGAALLPTHDDVEGAEIDATVQGGERQERQEPPRRYPRRLLCAGGLVLALVTAALANSGGQEAAAPLNAVAIAVEAESDAGESEDHHEGCCSYKGHTQCAKPWENCELGLGKDCCTGTPERSIKHCEKCKGEWITLPQSTCDKGHSLEKPLPHIWNYSKHGKEPLKVKILSFNLFWWHLFVKKHGENGKAGKLIKQTSEDMPYDIMAFQECQNPWHVLFDAGMDKTFTPWRTHENTCVAYRKGAWKELGRGEKFVAVDGNVPGQNFGKRSGMWLHLQHKKTNETVFFMNHHGPLPLSSGGQWGGAATAYNLLHLVEGNSTKGEAVIIVGDFNSVLTSQTIVQMSCGIQRVLSGKKFGGVDHVFTNVEESRVVSTSVLGQGGSDHNALSAVFQLGPKGGAKNPGHSG